MIFISFAKLSCAGLGMLVLPTPGRCNSRAGPVDHFRRQLCSQRWRPEFGPLVRTSVSDLLPVCLCSCLFGGLWFYCQGNRFSSCFFWAGYCFVVVVWNAVWGAWTFSPHFFLFPFLSFEFSFLKRFLFLNSGIKGRRFHFLWKSHCTDVCSIPPLAVFFSPCCLDADSGCLKYKGKVKITGCPSFLIVFLAVASQPFAGWTHVRLGHGDRRILSLRNNCFSE